MALNRLIQFKINKLSGNMKYISEYAFKAITDRKLTGKVNSAILYALFTEICEGNEKSLVAFFNEVLTDMFTQDAKKYHTKKIIEIVNKC